MTRRCLPFVSLPNDTVPVTSASMPASFGAARLEQLRHARQAARDVARLRRFLRNPREHFADRHLLAVLHRDDRAELERDVDRQVRARDA